MKIKYLLLLFVGGFLGSCKSDDMTLLEAEKQIKADYAAQFDHIFSFELMPDQDVVVFPNKAADHSMEILKPRYAFSISNVEKTLTPYGFIGADLKSENIQSVLLANTIYWMNSGDPTKIFTFGKEENNYAVAYDFDLNQGHAINPVKIRSLARDASEGFLYFDMANFTLNKLKIEGQSVFMAGSEKKGIKDGIGAAAGFEDVVQMEFHDKKIYFLDGKHSLRMAEQDINGSYKITTLYQNIDQVIKTIAIDEHGAMYGVLNKGLCKFDFEKSVFIPYVIGNKYVNVVKSLGVSYAANGLEFSDIRKMKILGDVIYIQTSSILLKISNFREVFASQYNASITL